MGGREREGERQRERERASERERERVCAFSCKGSKEKKNFTAELDYSRNQKVRRNVAVLPVGVRRGRGRPVRAVLLADPGRRAVQRVVGAPVARRCRGAHARRPHGLHATPAPPECGAEERHPGRRPERDLRHRPLLPAQGVGHERGRRERPHPGRRGERGEPGSALELGTYCGYSTVRIARLLPPGALLITLEFNPAYAAVARQVIAWAGLQDKVRLVEGPSGDLIPQMKELFGVQTFDFVFLDHWKDRYLPDAKLLEECGLLRKGSVLLADNVICPGTPEYLEYVRNSPRYESRYFRSHLEYTRAEDGLEKSVFLG
ncbi:hypothetical protein ANANG_G00228360 [Anguilla anguilla]|uniref:catechol O-methyltransferase n=1 Tax=Anguilla anguilla TaxID=7936 RepID=A0A9D3LYW0_ANGAN|nr:hypothetical protein ANANG_G00228360 [Anguilla anguilla]